MSVRHERRIRRLERLARRVHRELRRAAERSEWWYEAVFTEIHPPRPRGRNVPPEISIGWGRWVASSGQAQYTYTSPPSDRELSYWWANYRDGYLDPAAQDVCHSPTAYRGSMASTGRRSVIYGTWPTGTVPCPGEQGTAVLSGYIQWWAPLSVMQIGAGRTIASLGVSSIELTLNFHGTKGWQETAYDIVETNTGGGGGGGGGTGDPYYDPYGGGGGGGGSGGGEPECQMTNEVWLESQNDAPPDTVWYLWGWVSGSGVLDALQAAVQQIAQGAEAGSVQYTGSGTYEVTDPVSQVAANDWYWHAVVLRPVCPAPDHYPDPPGVAADAASATTWLDQRVRWPKERWLDAGGAEVYLVER